MAAGQLISAVVPSVHCSCATGIDCALVLEGLVSAIHQLQYSASNCNRWYEMIMHSLKHDTDFLFIKHK
jgi:hypothetical protein